MMPEYKKGKKEIHYVSNTFNIEYHYRGKENDLLK